MNHDVALFVLLGIILAFLILGMISQARHRRRWERERARRPAPPPPPPPPQPRAPSKGIPFSDEELAEVERERVERARRLNSGRSFSRASSPRRDESRASDWPSSSPDVSSMLSSMDYGSSSSSSDSGSSSSSSGYDSGSSSSSDSSSSFSGGESGGGGGGGSWND